MNMKLISTLALVATLATLPATADTSSPGQIDFGPITPPEDGQFVEVNVGSNLIAMAARLAE
ncbi:MAG TPA: hypothetical protein DCY13_21735, partial [Verrucomicrobiales bacterium]|nr:hypothetical protein [Verrucomicrobiales bacterium]